MAAMSEKKSKSDDDSRDVFDKALDAAPLIGAGIGALLATRGKSRALIRAEEAAKKADKATETASNAFYRKRGYRDDQMPSDKDITDSWGDPDVLRARYAWSDASGKARKLQAFRTRPQIAGAAAGGASGYVVSDQIRRKKK